MILIPTDPDYPRYTQRVTIEEQEFVLYFDYSSREDRWYLTVSLSDDTVLVRGWKLVTNVWLGPRIADRRMWGGALLVASNTTDQSPPGLGELGEDQRCQLYYLTAEELAS